MIPTNIMKKKESNLFLLILNYKNHTNDLNNEINYIIAFYYQTH
jgi:hypothetical protein